MVEEEVPHSVTRGQFRFFISGYLCVANDNLRHLRGRRAAPRRTRCISFSFIVWLFASPRVVGAAVLDGLRDGCGCTCPVTVKHRSRKFPCRFPPAKPMSLNIPRRGRMVCVVEGCVSQGQVGGSWNGPVWNETVVEIRRGEGNIPGPRTLLLQSTRPPLVSGPAPPTLTSMNPKSNRDAWEPRVRDHLKSLVEQDADHHNSALERRSRAEQRISDERTAAIERSIRDRRLVEEQFRDFEQRCRQEIDEHRNTETECIAKATDPKAFGAGIPSPALIASRVAACSRKGIIAQIEQDDERRAQLERNLRLIQEGIDNKLRGFEMQLNEEETFFHEADRVQRQNFAQMLYSATGDPTGPETEVYPMPSIDGPLEIVLPPSEGSVVTGAATHPPVTDPPYGSLQQAGAEFLPDLGGTPVYVSDPPPEVTPEERRRLLFSSLIDCIPVFGTAKLGVEFATGRETFTGLPIQRLEHLAGMIIPAVAATTLRGAGV